MNINLHIERFTYLSPLNGRGGEVRVNEYQSPH